MSEASQLYNFLHFRKAEKLLGKTLLQRSNLDKSIDFMDTIEEDIPKGNKLKAKMSSVTLADIICW